MKDPSFGHTFTACESIAEVWSKLTLCQMPLPNLIFVDYDLSRDYDHQLVQILKGFDELKAAPVIIFADPTARQEIEAACLQQMACFIILPTQPELRRQKIHDCLEFWSSHAGLPELRRWWDNS